MIGPQRCPVCGKELASLEEAKILPFCSQRCRQVDFFRWCEGKYAIIEPFASDYAEEDRSAADHETDE